MEKSPRVAVITPGLKREAEGMLSQAQGAVALVEEPLDWSCAHQ
jgi:hypothetical protein